MFLNVLAMHFSSIVPKEEVEKWGADWGTHPVGTGAYKIAEWTLGQRIVFERNPDYRHGTGPEDVPYLDQIVWEVGQDPSVAFLRLPRRGRHSRATASRLRTSSTSWTIPNTSRRA